MQQRFETLGFRVHLIEEEGVWVATARRADTGATFGPPVPGDRPDEAAELLARWLEWQHTHTTLLSALQSAQSEYHRVAGSHFALANAAEQRAARHAALVQLDDVRRQLDLVREQRPWPH